MRIIGLAILLALCVAACAPSEGDAGEPADAPASVPAPSRPPASAPVLFNGVDLARPISALGTEPFWGVKVEGSVMTLTGADRTEAVVQRAVLTADPAQAHWQGTTNGGGVLTLTVTAGPCSDGMSDRVYPLTAVVVNGTETLRGCAIATEALAHRPPA